MNKVNIGGDRLGSGHKIDVQLHGYERSTHDKSSKWRSTMASGTLVPFMVEVGLPGDTFDIDLECDVRTHPTIGPLFGSYKVQLDVFQCPIRIYNGLLHMNKLGIGNNMSQVKLPQIGLVAQRKDVYTDISQVNPSSLMSYLGIKGIGRHSEDNEEEYLYREFNAVPLLAYWDIVKQYYSNKNESKAYVIHNDQNLVQNEVTMFKFKTGINNTITLTETSTEYIVECDENTRCIIQFNNTSEPVLERIWISFTDNQNYYRITDLFTNVYFDVATQSVYANGLNERYYGVQSVWRYNYDSNAQEPSQSTVKLEPFPLENIDTMRELILTHVSDPSPFVITSSSIEPYSYNCMFGDSGKTCITSTQEGLAIKTYQSDINNNWLDEDLVVNGINLTSAVDTSQGYFTMDSLNLSKKVYEMLNRIAISGGTYDDWIDAVYTHERMKNIENPMYMGGLSKELAFQEVISTANSQLDDTEQPLGTLAGRGILTEKHKGGKIYIKIQEPSYIMGIVSITPRVCYSQGNKWDMSLKTMDDFHKPALDEIGMQDLITDTLSWQDTQITADEDVVFGRAGKQPAWLNYMTSVDEAFGNFADQNQQMFMVLNRRYNNTINGIADLTTYIDPAKFNHIFADTRLDAQNFWVQINKQMIVRRKMSAKVMPNL